MSTPELNRVYQKEKADCVLACIATVTDVSYSDLAEALGEDFGLVIEEGISCEYEAYLLGKFWKYSYINYERGASLYPNRTYLLTLPSLNYPNEASHRVVVQTGKGGEGIIFVHDPSTKDKRYGLEEGEANPKVFFEVTEIIYSEDSE